MIRLFVIEDHITVIVSGLRFLFRPDRDGIKVAGFATTVEDAKKNADPGSFDLFILDLHIPGHRPIDNIRKLKAGFPEKPIAIYTAETSSSWRKRMLEEGALTYITKDSTRDEFKNAIQKAARGEVFYFGKMGSYEQKDPDNDLFTKPMTLTGVQTEIVRLLYDGLSHEDIAGQIGVSRTMIEKILHNLRTTFKVKNNLELLKVLTMGGFI
jgi:DNA-binding NarL/FixJ family response regulator